VIKKKVSCDHPKTGKLEKWIAITSPSFEVEEAMKHRKEQD
jgi:hypothetical protein